MKFLILVVVALTSILQPAFAANLRLTDKASLKKLEELRAVDSEKTSARTRIQSLLEKMKAGRGSDGLDMRLAKATADLGENSRAWWLASLHVLAETLATQLETTRLQNEEATSLAANDLNQGTYRGAGPITVTVNLEETKELSAEVLALANYCMIQAVEPSARVADFSRWLGYLVPASMAVAVAYRASSDGYAPAGVGLMIGELVVFVFQRAFWHDYEVAFQPFRKTIDRFPQAGQRSEALAFFFDHLAEKLRVTLPEQMKTALRHGNPKVASNVICSLLLTSHLPKFRIAKTEDIEVLESETLESRSSELKRMSLKK